MTVGGVTLVALLTVIGVWRTGNRFFEDLRGLFTVAQPAPQVDVETLIVRQIQEASELTTAIFAMEAVVPTSRDRTLGGYVIGKTTLLYIAYGEVRAGVDLSKLQAENVQINDQAVRLELPPPEILDSKIDVTRSKVYDYDRGFLSLGPDAAPELQTLAQQETLRKIVEAACAQGVLEEANQKAEAAVAQLLNLAGYESISIQTQTPSAATCTVDTPVNPSVDAQKTDIQSTVPNSALANP